MELNPIDDGRCPRLRWKGLFYESMPDPTVPRSNDRSFWCNRTQICLGPDGKPVDEYECNEARSCFEK